MICFESTLLKRTFKEKDELDEDDDDDADEWKQDTWEKKKWLWLRFLLTATATSTLTQLWQQVEAIINNDDSSKANEIAVTAVNSNDSSE